MKEREKEREHERMKRVCVKERERKSAREIIKKRGGIGSKVGF